MLEVKVALKTADLGHLTNFKKSRFWFIFRPWYFCNISKGTYILQTFNSCAILGHMRILLIETINVSRGDGVETRYPPLSLAYLAANIPKNLNPEIMILRGGPEVAKYVRGLRPEVVGITSVTQNFNIALKIIEAIQGATNAPIVMGGHHVTHCPESVPDGIFKVIGEGEKTFNEILHTIKIGDIRNHSNYWEGRPVENLDELKPPIRYAGQLFNKEAHIMTSRGCPFDCVFCSSCNFWHGVRFHSPEHVVSEIKRLVKEQGVSAINIYDDLFAFNKSRLQKIYELIRDDTVIKNGDIEFSCLARASILDKDTVKLLKKIGVRNVAMGLESGNDEILKYLKGPKAHVKDNLKAIKLLNDYNINVVASFVYGAPEETYEQAMESIALAADVRIITGEAYLIIPYPGTPLWKKWKKEGWQKRASTQKVCDWSRFNSDFGAVKDRPIIVSEQMTAEQLWTVKEGFDEVFKSK